MKLLSNCQLIIKDLAVDSTSLPYVKNYKPISITAKNRQRNNNKRLAPQKKFSTTQLEATAQRILSARKHKITDQTNIILELQKQIETLQLENKTLKSQTYRQEKALIKVDSKQSDLPRILEQHQSEMLNLREHLRRTKDTLNNEIKQRKDSDNDILKLRSSLAKANQLVTDKHLGERSHLQLQLAEANEKLESSGKTLEITNRHLENLEKTHKREIVHLKKIIKHLETQYHDLEKELDQLKTSLKEKEKLLEIQNIYSHRIKIPHRIPGSAGDHLPYGVSSGLQSDQLLDKLNFINLTGKQNDSSKISNQSIQSDDITAHSNFIDPEKIKEDIRKILEEEILSGRIRSKELKTYTNRLECKAEVSPPHSPERSSPPQDSYNTGRTVASDIFDKEFHTQVESTIEDEQEVTVDLEKMERERKERLILVEKLNNIDKIETAVEPTEKSELKYSYPNDNDYVKNDPSINDIETISTTEVKKTTKSYKFNGAIENLHQGLPVQMNNGRHTSDSKRSSISSKQESTNFQLEASSNQKNNSNVDQSKEEPLPPLSEEDRQNKERELMAELFGQTQTNGTFKSRTTSLPWEKDDFIKPNLYNQPSNGKLRDLGKSDDLEEIIL